LRGVLLFVFLANRIRELCSPNPLGFFALDLLRQDRPAHGSHYTKKYIRGLTKSAS
jgi:hypothetical protein